MVHPEASFHLSISAQVYSYLYFNQLTTAFSLWCAVHKDEGWIDYGWYIKNPTLCIFFINTTNAIILSDFQDLITELERHAIRINPQIKTIDHKEK